MKKNSLYFPFKFFSLSKNLPLVTSESESERILICDKLSVTKDARHQIRGKNTQAESVIVHDQIKQVISAEWTLISLYKKGGWTPPRTDRRPVKVSELQSFISRRKTSSLMNNAGHDHLLPDTIKCMQSCRVYARTSVYSKFFFLPWNTSVTVINLKYLFLSSEPSLNHQYLFFWGVGRR